MSKPIKFPLKTGGKLVISDGRVLIYEAEGELVHSYSFEAIGRMHPDPGQSDSGLSVEVEGLETQSYEFEGRDTADLVKSSIRERARNAAENLSDDARPEGHEDE